MCSYTIITRDGFFKPGRPRDLLKFVTNSSFPIISWRFARDLLAICSRFCLKTHLSSLTSPRRTGPPASAEIRRFLFPVLFPPRKKSPDARFLFQKQKNQTNLLVVSRKEYCSSFVLSSYAATSAVSELCIYSSLTRSQACKKAQFNFQTSA